MSNFERAFMNLEDFDGTSYGITENLAELHGSSLEAMNETIAHDIIKEFFWDKMNLQEIQNSKLAGEVLSFAVKTYDLNKAVILLQQSYNVLNKNIQISLSGNLTKNDAQIINSYKFYKGLYKVLIMKQGNYYLELAESDDDILQDDSKDFLRQWVDNRI